MMASNELARIVRILRRTRPLDGDNDDDGDILQEEFTTLIDPNDS